MKLKKCALCNVDLCKDKKSKEHIIPNAIGGKQTIDEFICLTCNNETGNKWDNVFCEQLKFWCNFFQIKKSRGIVQDVILDTINGKRITQKSNGDIEYVVDRKPITINGKHKYEFPNIKEVNKKKTDFEKKHPGEKFEIKTTSISGPHLLKSDGSFPTGYAGKTIVKSALAMAVKNKILSNDCEHAKSYLLDKGPACFGLYYEKDLMQNRPEGIPLHCVYVKGEESSKLLVAYIEFFGIFRIISCLSNSYEGEDFEDIIAINPLNGNDINDLKILNFSIEDISDSYKGEKLSSESIQTVMDAMLASHLKQPKKNVFDAIIQQAISNCSFKEGQILASDDFSKIADNVVKELRLYIRQ